MAITIQTTTYNVIYVYSRDAHPGLLKIGKTSVDTYDLNDLTPNCDALNKAAYERFHEAVTLGVTDLKLLYTDVAVIIGSDGQKRKFDDHDVHSVLECSNYEKADLRTSLGTPNEWFKVDLNTAIKAIVAVKNEQYKIDGPSIIVPTQKDIVFRTEQSEAIRTTVTHFADGGDKMLWNAKMRFGKTLCALELINQLDVKRVLILTHRPTVRSGWFEDYHLIKFKSEFQYGSKSGKSHNSLNNKDYEGKDLATLKNALDKNGIHYIYFASMQDLRGKEKDKSGNHVWKGNNKLVYENEWDLIIFDEAHEGTQTKLGQEVSNDLFKNSQPLKLYLSGTPYNILDQFSEDEIYTWDYIMEQKAKEMWPKLNPDKTNPYEGLAKLNIYTYNLGEVYENSQYTKSEDDYFNFAEFFRVWSGKKEKDGREMPPSAKEGEFIHEQDVMAFLDLLCREYPESFYPYSNQDFRNALSHTLWMLPGVEQANRLAILINKHKLHTEYGYEVISVAGEGLAIEAAGDNINKIENYEKDALKRVKTALKQHNKTITLSCGRLTTGVSIPEWTGVFMLSGGYSTGAANYMQTIFRGQTPYKNGAIKTNCYAFDFAPDRTLTVIDDYIKMQPSSRHHKEETYKSEQENTEDTLRFMPVVAMVGGMEIEYDAIKFINKVNQAYTDHVISHGFKSRHLFKNFAKFTDEDHTLLEKIGNLVGGTKVSTNSDGTIDMSVSDMKGDSKPKNGKKSNKKKPADKNPKEKPKEKLDKIKRSQSVLDYIFVRMPLLLFGTITNADRLSVDNFINDLLSNDFIDDESWKEFMPKNFTKPIFRQITHLLKVNVLIASTAEIIKQAKVADEMPIEERVIEIARLIAKFHFPDKETVLTPWRVVNKHMTDTLGGYDFYDETHTHLSNEPRLIEQEITTELFCNPETKILELNSKSGVYPLWIAFTLWKLLGHDGMTQDEEWTLWKTILEKNLFVVCKTRMAEKITKRVLVGYRTSIHTNTVSYENIIERIKDENEHKKLIEEIKNPATYGNVKDIKPMNFDAIVSNPPYQVMDGGNKASAVPVYQHFVTLAKRIQPEYISMIMPAKWFNGGRGLDSFRAEMLADKSISILFDYIDTHDCFSIVDIAGGICYFLRERKHKGMCSVTTCHRGQNRTVVRPLNESEIFIRAAEELSVIRKVRQISKHFFDSQVFSQKPFGLRTYVVPCEKGDIVLRYNGGQGPFKREDVPQNSHLIDKWKVITSYSTNEHAGEYDKNGMRRIISTLEMLKPGVICTETYLLMSCFETQNEASSLIKYIKTRFTRFVLSAITTTQHLSKSNFQFVPLQDFTDKSDIDWSVSVAEIDKQLYKKYGLTQEEIDYIESTIKPME